MGLNLLAIMLIYLGGLIGKVDYECTALTS